MTKFIDNTTRTISEENQDVSAMDASFARKLLHESLVVSQERHNESQDAREELALKLLAGVLRKVRSAAENGNTQTEFFIRDRSIPADHRSGAVQKLQVLLDDRGFNVLTCRKFSILGSGYSIQIEW